MICAVLVLGAAPAAHAAYDDVSGSHWAEDAVRYVAEQNKFMAFSGTLFRPNRAVTRRVLARAIVKAFAPTQATDPAITFSDLAASDPWFKYANVAVKNRWLARDGDAFAPDATVRKRVLDKAMVLALGLAPAARGLSRIKENSGDTFTLPPAFAYLVIAGNLRLHYNHPTGAGEKDERYPWQAVSRADTAYALWQAKRAQGSWLVSSLSKYETITLRSMSDGRHRAVEFALAYAGYPYIYAGEWHRKTPDAYCCGAQVHGGFDCSGYAWWVLKRAGGGYDNTHVRPYRGWTLAERASYQMAGATETKIKLADLRALDVVFFDTDGKGTGAGSVDHAGISLGGGWMIHSSGGRAGVTIDWIGDGWWAGAYKWGRRIYGS